MKPAVQNEISLIAHSLNVAVTAVNWGAVAMPTWAHILVSIGTATLTGLANREQVTPNRKIGA